MYKVYFSTSILFYFIHLFYSKGRKEYKKQVKYIQVKNKSIFVDNSKSSVTGFTTILVVFCCSAKRQRIKLEKQLD